MINAFDVFYNCLPGLLFGKLPKYKKDGN